MVGDVKPQSVDHILPNLPAALAEIAVAVAAIKADQPPLLSQDALGVLVNAADGDLPLRRFRVAVDSHVPLPVDDDIRCYSSTRTKIPTQPQPWMQLPAVGSRIWCRLRSITVSRG